MTSTSRTGFTQAVYVWTMPSLLSQNSPRSDLWCRLASSSNWEPFGRGLPHSSWWYLRSVALWLSGSRPRASVRTSNLVSIRDPPSMTGSYAVRAAFEWLVFQPAGGPAGRRDLGGGVTTVTAISPG